MITRRDCLVLLAGIPLAGQIGEAEANTWVDPRDPMAKSLGYVPVSTVAGQQCRNCIQYVDAGRKCNLFPGQQVTPEAWCKVWVKKP